MLGIGPTVWSNRSEIATGASHTAGPNFARRVGIGGAPNRACTLARAPAQSGDPVAIAVYPGGDDAFDRAITDFSEHYAHQNEQDFRKFVKAVRPAEP